MFFFGLLVTWVATVAAGISLAFGPLPPLSKAAIGVAAGALDYLVLQGEGMNGWSDSGLFLFMAQIAIVPSIALVVAAAAVQALVAGISARASAGDAPDRTAAPMAM